MFEAEMKHATQTAKRTQRPIFLPPWPLVFTDVNCYLAYTYDFAHTPNGQTARVASGLATWSWYSHSLGQGWQRCGAAAAVGALELRARASVAALHGLHPQVACMQRAPKPLKNGEDHFLGGPFDPQYPVIP